MRQLYEISNRQELEQVRTVLQRRLKVQKKELNKDLNKFSNGWYIAKFVGSSLRKAASSVLSKIDFMAIGISIAQWLFRRKKKK